MNVKLEITSPSGNVGFVESKRSFVVEGNIISDVAIPEDCVLSIEVYDANHNIVRYISCKHKNGNIFYSHPDLVTYSDELDPNRIAMREFGFPILSVDDIDSPYDSLNKGNIKAWYNNFCFKAVVINGSDSRIGTIFKTGIEFVDENNKPYEFLDNGKYRIEVYLKYHDEILNSCFKEIIIGYRDRHLICRFNPLSHKQAMIDWCKTQNISIITDLIPGYLDAYLGKWYYHMGLLKMYRANDIYLFEKANVIMFDYLIDSTSTSYETELAYLQANCLIEERLSVYYYDIGEANILDRKANIKRLENNEYGIFCRVDEIDNISEENKYYLNRAGVNKSHFDLKNIEIESESIAIMGVIKPIQLDPNDFVLKDDNTYEIYDYPEIIRYRFNIDGNIVEYDRKLNMERIDDESIGFSVYEFYNKFNIKNYKNILIEAKCIYHNGRVVNIPNRIEIFYGRN